jgi:glycosyltransferase involved in cell wall biosynthesis
MAGDRPLRLALISSGLGHELRGIEMWMAELALHLPAEAEVELWPGGRLSLPGCTRPIRRMWNIGRHHPLIRLCSWAHRYEIEQYSAIPSVLWRLRQRRPDVVYCGDPVLAWNLKRFRRWHGARVVFTDGMRLSPHWLRGYDGVHLLAPPYLAEANRILTGIPKGHYFAVPYFVDTARFRPPTPEERTAARAAFGLPQDAFIVLTIGPVGQVSGKRLDFLASEVAAGSSTALLVSAGGDEDGSEAVRAHVTRALGARAKLLGRVDRQRIPQLHWAADVYSLGTLAEPFSIAVLEALACGTPVIHHHETVMTWQSGVGGFAVSMETPGEAAAAIRQVAANPQLRAEKSRAARALALERYSPGPVGATLVRELRQVAERPLGLLK